MRLAHLTYRGSTSLESIDDTLKKRLTMGLLHKYTFSVKCRKKRRKKTKREKGKESRLASEQELLLLCPTYSVNHVFASSYHVSNLSPSATTLETTSPNYQHDVFNHE